MALVRAVGERLRLEREARELPVPVAALADGGPVEVAAGVHLHAGLGGLEAQRSTRPRVPDLRGRRQAALARQLPEAPVVVPADLGWLQPVEMEADGMPLTEVERGPGNREHLARWQQLG